MNYVGFSGLFSDKSLDFMRKILEWLGLGDLIYVLVVIMSILVDCLMVVVWEEVVINMFCFFDELFVKIGVNFKDVKILVVNSSVFCLILFFFVMVVNWYKMCSDIKSINVLGMGCSVGLIVIDLVKDFFYGCYWNFYVIVCS